jgi:predicted  nucleic acid-binding Zn ribbon protein
MILGGVSWHEHQCPSCGDTWTCADGEKNIIARRKCEECLVLDEE